MGLSDEAVNEFKEIFKKEHGKDLTDAEAREYGEQLVGFCKVVADAAFESWKKDQKLKQHPKGYRLEATAGTYTCIICYNSITGSDVWWDQSGPKCDLCQKAIWKKIVPRSVCKGRLDSWYAIWQLEDKFGIKPPTARKLVREGKLKARIIPDDNGKPHYYVFLKKENPKLVEYEEQHKYMTEECKCKNPDCSHCLQVVCLQKDCSVHPLEKKAEPRTSVIERLEVEREKSLDRSVSDKLDEHIRDFNKKDADEKERHIHLLEKSLGLTKSAAKKRPYRLLITGIPGTGKTTVGDELAQKHDFKHLDFESDAIREFLENPATFIEKLAESKRHIVITWGFMPEKQTELVLQLKESGFKLIWFDGNREAARKAFNKRGTVPEKALYIQLGNIESFNVVDRIQPIRYDTFDKKGRFKALPQIIEEIQGL